MTTVQAPTTAAMPQQNLYRILNIPQTASAEEVKKAIIQGSRLWSNRTNAPQIEKRQEAERMVKFIEEAEGILLDPTKRERYDRQLATATPRHDGQHSIPHEQDGHADPTRQVVGDMARTFADKAHVLLQRGEYPAAICQLRKALEIEPANVSFQAKLAEAKRIWAHMLITQRY